MAEHIIMQNLPETMKQFYSQLETQESFRGLLEKHGGEISKILGSTEALPEDIEGVRSLVTQSIEDLFPKGKE